MEAITAALDAINGALAPSTPPTAHSCCARRGKIEQRNKHALKTRDDLSMAYTPAKAKAG